MNPILLARHVEESLRELVHTTLNSSSHAFDGMVDRFIEEPANFIKGPWISVRSVRSTELQTAHGLSHFLKCR